VKKSVFFLIAVSLAFAGVLFNGSGLSKRVSAQGIAAQPAAPLRCIDFSPYVNGYNPKTGPHPSAQLIDQLFDKLIQQTSFRCIMTYGVLNGLDHIIPAAKQRSVKVLMVIWLDGSSADAASIKRGIKLAKKNRGTIIRVSCGSEIGTRYNSALGTDPIINNCVDKLRGAGVKQPITSIDTWWKWCVESLDCKTRSPLADKVDWIGINIFPWWENKFSGEYTCTTATQAPQFHIDRMQQVLDLYWDKEVILTEFGWPAGPNGYSETNTHTGEQCGVASKANQNQVIQETLNLLDEKGWSGNVFAAFREKWKKLDENPIGPFWGICKGKVPFKCPDLY